MLAVSTESRGPTGGRRELAVPATADGQLDGGKPEDDLVEEHQVSASVSGLRSDSGPSNQADILEHALAQIPTACGWSATMLGYECAGREGRSHEGCAHPADGHVVAAGARVDRLGGRGSLPAALGAQVLPVQSHA